MPNSPISPLGTSTPPLSKKITSVEGSGSPIEPLYSFKVYGLTVTQGDASVRPYPSSNGKCVTDCHCSAVTCCTAIPPPNTKCKWLKSSSLKAGFFNKAANKVLTPVMIVNLNFFISFSMLGISRGLMIKTFKPPVLIKRRQLPNNEKI